MPHHVIVDGSNLATEGRTLPSLHQLNDAVSAYRGDHPDTLITVVVDATFGHRIDPKEVPEFEKAIETNAFVAPPAGAVGRGDGFILSIAQKTGASILSNDSYQEFHGEYAWLFVEGRLIGGKPVPHVGWVFVNRVPVRGPISRRSVKEQKVVDKSPGRGRGRKSAAESLPAISADGPMPVPKTPPPGAAMATSRPAREPRATNRQQSPKPPAVPNAAAAADPRSTAARSTNDLMPFLTFVEHFPVGTAVTAIVESYSSHGAYVSIGDAKGYVPLRLMADPAPRSAREVMAIGESVTLVVNSFEGARRSIDLAVPAMAPPAPPVAAPKARKAAAKRAAAGAARLAEAGAIATEAIATEAVEASASTADEVETRPGGQPTKARATKKAAGSRGGRSPKTQPAVGAATPQATFDDVFNEPAATPMVATPTADSAPLVRQSAKATRPAKSARGRRVAASAAAAPVEAAVAAVDATIAAKAPTKSSARVASKPTPAKTITPAKTAKTPKAAKAPETAKAPKIRAAPKQAVKKQAVKKQAVTPKTPAPAKASTKPSESTAGAPVAVAKKSGGRRRPTQTNAGS